MLRSSRPRGTSFGCSKNTHCVGLTAQLCTWAPARLREEIESERPREGRFPAARSRLVEPKPVVRLPASKSKPFPFRGPPRRPFKRDGVVPLCDPGREPKAALIGRLGERAGHSGSRAWLPRDQMLRNSALQALLLTCWVFMIFFKVLIKENAIMMFLT